MNLQEYKNDFELLENILDYEKSYELPRNTNKRLERLDRSFFSSSDGLYYEREDIEADLKAAIAELQRPISLEGVQGCGKSTTLIKVLEELNKDEYPRIYIDFDDEYRKYFNDCSDEKTWWEAIKNRIRDKIKLKFFNIESNNHIKMYSHYIFIEPDGDDYKREIERITLKNINLKAWYLEKRKQNEDIKKIEKEIDKKITYDQLIRALKPIKNFKGFLVIFDNVDRIERESQQFCFKFTVDFMKNVKKCGTIIICIREENARYPANDYTIKKSNIKSIPMVCRKFSEKKERKLDPKDFYAILKKRNAFYQKESKNYELKRVIDFLIKNLESTYAESRLIDLGNQSIRDSMNYHCKFVKAVIEYYRKNKFDLNQIYELFISIQGYKRRSFLNSHFLGWVADQIKGHSAQCLNLIEVFEKCELKFYAVGCDLNYLILVNLLNYKRLNNDDSITLSQLAKNLRKIGYEKENIRENVFYLYNLRYEPLGEAITIIAKNEIRKAKDLTDNTKIEINFRGECLVKYISVSFTFINRILFFASYYEDKKNIPVNDYYNFRNYFLHVKNSVLFLGRIAKLHMIELRRIYDKYNNKEDWLIEYKKQFCMGKEGTYKLQLERIIDSNCRFLKNLNAFITSPRLNSYIDILNKLKRLYQEEIKQFNISNLEFKKLDKVIRKLVENPNLINYDFNSREYKDNIVKYLENK